MEEDEILYYLVFRVYSKKERPERSERSRYYGWTDTKAVIKCFMTQRNPKKYKVIKVTDTQLLDEAEYMVVLDGIDTFDDVYKLDFVKLKSAESNEEFKFFSTADELRETEIKIQRRMNNLCSLSNPVLDKKFLKGREMELINMIVNLKNYYFDALWYIGFRPEEISMIFPPASDHEGYSLLDDVEVQIHSAYDGYGDYPSEDNNIGISKLPGLSVLEDVPSKIVYSLESFISVLKEDL